VRGDFALVDCEPTGEVGVTSESGIQAVRLRQRGVPLKCRLLLRSQTSA
jgi:hypothetical protein